MMIESQAATVQSNLGSQMNLEPREAIGLHHPCQTKRVKQLIVDGQTWAVGLWLHLLLLVKIIHHNAQHGQKVIYIYHREILFMRLLC